MSPEAQRIAIAEACGIKCAERGVSKIAWGWAKDAPLPDYLNDLDAMHEAEGVLTDEQWDEYERHLRAVCGACAWYEGADKALLHATAAQRAEAFLRTLGKWVESQ